MLHAYLELLLPRYINIEKMDLSVFHDQVTFWVVHSTGVVNVVRVTLDLRNGT